MHNYLGQSGDRTTGRTNLRRAEHTSMSLQRCPFCRFVPSRTSSRTSSGSVRYRRPNEAHIHRATRCEILRLALAPVRASRISADGTENNEARGRNGVSFGAVIVQEVVYMGTKCPGSFAFQRYTRARCDVNLTRPKTIRFK